MTDNNLLITDDVKSAFADLMGRNLTNKKTHNIDDIKIEGKHIALQPNPVQTHSNTIDHVSSPQPPSLPSSHTTPTNPSKHQSSSASTTTPLRGSVLASYIQRFRKAPALDRNQRNTKTNHTSSDFWWIKAPANTNIHSQRPNTAPNTTSHIQNQDHVIKSNGIQCLSQSVRSSISDDRVSFKDITHSPPKPIEYKSNPTKSNDSTPSTKHSSIDSSPKPSSIIHSPEIKEQDTESDKTIHSSPHYFTHQSSPRFAEDHDTNIDVDDILEKWRKKRRLTQLATENGMSPNNNDLHCNPISDLLTHNDTEVDRIKKRLGLLSNEPMSVSTPTQPFTATIHPIPFPHAQSNAFPSQFYPQYSSHDPSIQYTSNINPNHHHASYVAPSAANPTYHGGRGSENSSAYPTTPIRTRKTAKNERKEEEGTPRRLLSPRCRKNAPSRSSHNFLMDQQYLKEQQAKTERLARIQRRMCFDEKKVLDHTKSAEKVLPAGRQKKLASPSPQRSCCKVQKKLWFEDEEKDEAEPDSDDCDILNFVSKSVQTQPDVSTPQMTKTQSERLKNSIITIGDTKAIVSAPDPMELLPDDMLSELKKLEKDGLLTNANDFDVHFRRILNAHDNGKAIADNLLKFMVTKDVEDTVCDEKKEERHPMEIQSPLKRMKAPLPSPKRSTVNPQQERQKRCDEKHDDTCELDEKMNQNVKDDRKDEDQMDDKEDIIETNEVNNEEIDDNTKEIESEECKMESERVLSVSLCCDISNIDDMNKKCDDDGTQNVNDIEMKEMRIAVHPNPFEINTNIHSNTTIRCRDSLQPLLTISAPQTIMKCRDDDVLGTVHRESDIIKRWIEQHPDHYWPPSTQSDCDVIRDFVKSKDTQNGVKCTDEAEQCLNDNEFINSESQTTSIYDDVEIMALMQSCKSLRHDISTI